MAEGVPFRLADQQAVREFRRLLISISLPDEVIR